jgi:hypothetical protein
MWLAHCFNGIILEKLKDFVPSTQIVHCLRFQEADTCSKHPTIVHSNNNNNNNNNNTNNNNNNNNLKSAVLLLTELYAVVPSKEFWTLQEITNLKYCC